MIDPPPRGTISVMQILDAPRVTGVMHTLDRSGDTRVMWDKNNQDEVDAARRQFRDLRAKGYLAYRAEGKKGERGAQIREFDAQAERIILVRPLQGG